MSNMESSRVREEDEESELSESQSISSDVAFGRHIAEADMDSEDEKAQLSGDEAEDSDHGFGEEFDEDCAEAFALIQPIVTTDEEGEHREPEVTLEQQAQIDARPRMVLRRAGAPLSSGSSPYIQQPTTPQQPTAPHNPGPSSATPIPSPESTAKQPMDKGKGKEVEVLFDDDLTLNAEEIEGIQNLNSKQKRHLIESFRLEITAEARPAIRQELRSDLEEEIQGDFDEKLAEEKEKWAEEKRKINEKARATERESFGQGKEEGERAAIAAHAARWTSMEKQLEDKTQQLQTREDELDQKQARLEGHRDRTNALDAEVAYKAQTIARQTGEIAWLRREGNACVTAWNRQLQQKNDEINYVRAEAVSQLQYTLRLRDELFSEQLTQQRATLALTSMRTQHRQSSALTDNSLSELTENLSKLSLRQEVEVPTPMPPTSIPANSTAGQNQPRADDCAARLQDLRARLEQRRARELNQRAAGMRKGLRRQARAYRAKKDAELARATARGLEENRRLGEVVLGLEREREASDAKLEGMQKASQEANRTIQSLGKQARRLGEDQRWIVAFLEMKKKDCARGVREQRLLEVRLKKIGWTADVAALKVEELEGDKEAADAEVRSLTRANLALSAKNRELEMDATLGATPQFPWWKGFALCFLVALLGLLVAVFWAA